MKCEYCKSIATKKLIWADGRAFVPICDDHVTKAKSEIRKHGKWADVVGVKKIREMTLAEALIEYKVDTAISGACFDLLGYLTTRPTSIPVGADSLCPPVLERFLAWAKIRGLSIDDADVKHWEHVLGRNLMQ